MPARYRATVAQAQADRLGELDDPNGQDLDTVRRIVGEVEQRVRRLLTELGVEVAA